jgi:hypothetical protein
MPFLILCIVRLDLAEGPFLFLFHCIILVALSSMRGLRDEYKGFWIGRLDFLALLYNYNQLYQLRIHDCLRLAPFLAGLWVSAFPPRLTWFWFTNLTYLASVVRWLTLHSWIMNSLTTELLLPRSSLHGSLYRPWRMLSRKHAYRTVVCQWIIPCLFVAAGTCLPNRWLVLDLRSGSVIPGFRRQVTVWLWSCKALP